MIPLGRNFKFEQMDAQSILYGDKSFDAVIANHMLYHVPDREKALAEIKRVLNNDGHLIATTVGNAHIQEIVQWLKRVRTKEQPLRFSSPFTLENGQEQLQKFFSQVAMSRYVDNLEVTEIAPLFAYIRSSLGAVDLSEEKLGELKQICNGSPRKRRQNIY